MRSDHAVALCSASTEVQEQHFPGPLPLLARSTNNEPSPAERSRAADQNNRLYFVDALRGMAALSVTIYHLYSAGPFRSTLEITLPNWVSVLLNHGWLGVPVFFVISGFVICHSLSSLRLSARTAGQFVLRRIIRLDPPYWATIAATILLTVVSNYFLRDRIAEIPSAEQVASHAFYLQGVLGLPQIVPVFWTLCIEVQFYLTMVLLLWTCASLRLHPIWVAMPIAIAAVASLGYWPATGVWLLSYFHLFFLGCVTCWTFRKTLHPAIFWSAIGVALACGQFFHQIDMLVAAVTAALIYVTSQLTLAGRSSFRCGAMLQYLGLISYSLYLLHVPIGTRIVNLGHRVTGDHSGAAVGWIALGLIGSIASAHLLHRYVEGPSLRLAKRVRYAPA